VPAKITTFGTGRREFEVWLANVRFGSKGDISAELIYVRFIPESGR
jgi:hypothetical protein